MSAARISPRSTAVAHRCSDRASAVVFSSSASTAAAGSEPTSCAGAGAADPTRAKLTAQQAEWMFLMVRLVATVCRGGGGALLRRA